MPNATPPTVKGLDPSGLLSKIQSTDRTSSSGEALKLPCALSSGQCAHCHGLGYRMQAQGALAKAELCECVQHCPGCFGKARRIVDRESKECRQPNPAKVANVLSQAGIPAKFAAARLDQFANASGNTQQITARVRQWLQEFQIGKSKGFLLGGPVGVGKTYLLVSVAKYLASKGYSVKFVDFFHLLSQLKAAYSSDGSEQGILGPLLNVDVLFIDEIGKGRNSDWELTIIDSLVTSRYDANQMIIGSTNYRLSGDSRIQHMRDLDQEHSTSGFSPDNFDSLEARIGKRIFSRMVETCHLWEMTGNDYRRVLAQSHRV